ncbi:MAG TPA: clostripain-related cysteine peptidase [Elusimicrobiales bacterium]|nr:clostripain-related cysteine peptidase [Elusimicrobiales bacterium]
MSTPVGAIVAAKDWTLMVFMSGRNNLASFTSQDINRLEQAGSGQNVNVVVQVATLDEGSGATRYHIVKDEDPKLVASKPIQIKEVDMGSKAALLDFAKWSVKNYPAQKYALVIWGHGFGWTDSTKGNEGKQAVSPDMATGNSLSNKELASVLGSVSKAIGKPLDILATDACGMQMLSVVAELKKTVKIVLGSEDVVPADFGFSYDAIVKFLEDNAAASPEALAKFISEEYRNSHPEHIGVSAVNTAEVAGFIKVLNVWLDAVVATGKHGDISESVSLLPGLYEYSNASDMTSNPMSKDIFQLVEAVTDALKSVKAASPGLKAAAKAVMGYHSKVIISNSQGDLTGLAEYVPKELYNSAYDELFFSRASRWDDFVKWLLDSEYEYPKTPVPDDVKHRRGS